MSRLRVSPTEWRDEGPQRPYSPTIRYTGSMALPVTGKLQQIRIVTPAERERHARAHAAYNLRHKRLRKLTDRQREVLAVLERHAGNRTRTANELGVDVRSIQFSVRKIIAAGIEVPPPARRGPDLQPRKRAA